MNISDNNSNKRAKDPIDILIFEKGVRAKDLIIYKDLDLMVVVLNVGKVLNLKISEFPRLKDATEQELKDWKLIGEGIGFEWDKFDEHLSLKGFIKSSALNAALESLEVKDELTIAS